MRDLEFLFTLSGPVPGLARSEMPGGGVRLAGRFAEPALRPFP